MRSLLLSVLCLAALTPALADTLHLEEVNPVLKAIADAVVSGDELVDFATPTFDTSATDLAAERLKYSLVGALHHAPWGNGARVTSTLALSTDRNPRHLGIKVVFGAVSKTDTLALARYAGRIALREVEGVPSRFDQRVRDLLRRLTVVQTLEELASLVGAGQALAVEMIQAHIDDAKSHGQDGSRWTRMQRAYAQTRVVRRPGVNHGLSRIELSNQDSPGDFLDTPLAVTPSRVYGSLSRSEVRFTLIGFAEVPAERLNQLKADLEEILLKLQAHDEKGYRDTRHAFEEALYRFKQVIHWKK